MLFAFSKANNTAMNYIFHPYDFNVVESAILMMQLPAGDEDHNESDSFADDLNLNPPDEDLPEEGSWGDEEDEDFEDQVEWRDDMNEIRAGDDLNEPDPEDDDHLPDDDLQ